MKHTMNHVYGYSDFLNEKDSTLITESIEIPDVIKKIAKKIVDKYPKKAKAVADKYKGLSLEQIIQKLNPSFKPLEDKMVPETNEGIKDIISKIKNKIIDYQESIDKVLTTVGLVGLGRGTLTTIIDATNAVPGVGHFGDSMFAIAAGLSVGLSAVSAIGQGMAASSGISAVAEDEKLAQLIGGNMLINVIGCDVDRAANGKQALAFAKKNK